MQSSPFTDRICTAFQADTSDEGYQASLILYDVCSLPLLWRLRVLAAMIRNLFTSR